MAICELIVRNVQWLGQVQDLLVARGRILELALPGVINTDCARVYDARGLTLLPSLIDAHVHLREPGQEYKEDIASGLRAALEGGFGQVMAMANTRPVNDSATVTKFMLGQAKLACPQGPWVRPVGALTVGLAGKELAPIGELAQAGCVALSNDGLPVKNNELFRRGLEYGADFGLKVIDHCEDPWLGAGGVMNEGQLSGRLGLKGIPGISEAIQVARDILLASYLDLPVHLAHISCRESVELIAQAKAKGVPVTAETCPHYLLWDEELVAGYNTNARVNPPLRTHDDVLALRQAVRAGVIDILVTDHAPHANFEKEVPFDEAPNGISGLDTALALTNELLRQNVLTLADLAQLWCWNTAKIFNLPSTAFLPGDPADFILVDLDQAWRVTPETMRSKGKNTPCLQQDVMGQVQAHFLGGLEIFLRDRSLAISTHSSDRG